jgi:mannose-1-phosphate guanylyltransferase
MQVKTFTEKPDIDLARVFLESGDFYWNSGIFHLGC